MKQIIRDYLTFNKRERNGILVLLAIIAIMIVYLGTSHLFIQPEKVDFTKFEKEIQAFNISKIRVDDFKNKNNYQINEAQHENENAPENLESERFVFNPNGLSASDWKRLGLTDNQIKAIVNYQAKGGKFRNKEDLKKMYCISEKQYSSLESYIQIPEQKKEFYETIHSYSKKSIVEINSADSTQLVALKGIGSFYAKAIIKYRNILGGFVDKEQLMEVWKFDSIKFESVKMMVTVDPLKIKKININSCTASELKHPYLTWNSVNAICKYRIMHGSYKTVAEIKNTDLVDDKTYAKIAPYLVIE